MLYVENLSFTYPAAIADRPADHVFQGVSFAVERGAALTVTGASGSGKSTLLHMLAGLAPRYTGGHASGVVRVAGADMLLHPPDVGKVGLLFQDATTQLFSTTAEHEIAWGLEALGLPPQQITARVADALTRFGLWEVRKRAPWALSGGQQKRLALAVLWAMEPEVLLLDQPLGGLDAAGRSEVMASIEALRESGHTTVVASLRPQLMALSATTLVLEQGSPMWVGPSKDLLADPALLVQTGVLYPPHLWPQVWRTRVGGNSEVVVEMQDVHFTYSGGVKALCGIDLQLCRGEFVALVGPNGAGKTTLARHLNGLLRPGQGRVTVFGQATERRSVGDLARHVGFLFQRPEQQLFSPTVRAEISYGPQQLGLPDIGARVASALAMFDLEAVADLPPTVLSYGQQRAVTLASLAAIGAPILVLDEPSVGLDGRGWQHMLTWLAACRAQGVTVVMITHEPDLAACADRIVTLRAGRVVEDGPPTAPVISALEQGAL